MFHENQVDWFLALISVRLIKEFTSKFKDIKMKVQRSKLMKELKLKDHRSKIDKILGLVHHWQQCRSFAVVPSVAYTRQDW